MSHFCYINIKNQKIKNEKKTQQNMAILRIEFDIYNVYRYLFLKVYNWLNFWCIRFEDVFFYQSHGFAGECLSHSTCMLQASC